MNDNEAIREFTELVRNSSGRYDIMKTHEIARALTELARILRSVPDQTLDEFAAFVGKSGEAQPRPVFRRPGPLAALSDFDKSQWLTLIQECGFDIDVRPHATHREILLESC